MPETKKISITMNEWANRISIWRENKGFYTPSGIGDPEKAAQMLTKLMLVVTELSEAGEAARKSDMENFTEELADTIIRLLDITGTCGIDIDKAVADKMLINEGRPYRHGKQC
jgi:NTP pyrophosphatase (non-canonical NTP hydrolase)